MHCRTLPHICSLVDSLVGSLRYQAESPDEKALVEAAAELGFTFIKRSGDRVVVHVKSESQASGVADVGAGAGAGRHNPGYDIQFQVLAVNAFTSTRKRMSVVVRWPDGSLRLLCKGADNIILDRLREEDRGTAWDRVEGHLNKFAVGGLRTLVLAQRRLSEDEFAAWSVTYEAARLVIGEGNALSDVAEEIEQSLELVGVTAIEDKLQDQVPETISDLAEAQIKLWVLTGGKAEVGCAVVLLCC